jgi:hypothetical protein
MHEPPPLQWSTVQLFPSDVHATPDPEFDVVQFPGDDPLHVGLTWHSGAEQLPELQQTPFVQKPVPHSVLELQL